MPTIERTSRATLTTRVEVNFTEDEYIDTFGDRRRGLNTRRPARIIGYVLNFQWLPTAQRWDLQESYSAVSMEQQRADCTWGAAQPRAVTYETGPALESAYAPTSNPVVTW
jgi:hypothetical protein